MNRALARSGLYLDSTCSFTDSACLNLGLGGTCARLNKIRVGYVFEAYLVRVSGRILRIFKTTRSTYADLRTKVFLHEHRLQLSEAFERLSSSDLLVPRRRPEEGLVKEDVCVEIHGGMQIDLPENGKMGVVDFFPIPAIGTSDPSFGGCKRMLELEAEVSS